MMQEETSSTVPIRQEPPEEPPSLEDSDDAGIPPQTLFQRIISWAVALPWWAIILITIVVTVLYSMFASVEYQKIIKFVTDKPQVVTNDLYDIVQVVEHKNTVSGTLVGETEDTVPSVIFSLLDNVLDLDESDLNLKVTDPSPAAIIIETDSGERVEIPKNEIDQQEPENVSLNSPVTVEYVSQEIITGTVVEEDGDSIKVRTVDKVEETFDVSRVKGDPTPAPCNETAGPECQDGDLVTIQREGAIIHGTLVSLSQTNMSLKLDNGETREIRRGDVDYVAVPTLSVALNEESAGETIQAGQQIRLGYVDGTEIVRLLEDVDSLADIPVPLYYQDGDAQVELTAYADVNAAMTAVSSGEVDGLVYIDQGPDREAVVDWADENPDALIVLPELSGTYGARPGLLECPKDCAISVKLQDDEITGRIIKQNEKSITVRTTEAVYRTIDKDDMKEEDRHNKTEPGTCALNNPSGCNAGIFLTLQVTLIAYALALMIGLFIGLMRVAKNPIFYAFSTLYVEVIRGIPLLVILVYAGFVVKPWINKQSISIAAIDLAWHPSLSMKTIAIVGLAFGYGAFVAEIFRAGIQSISRGQMEAARSLGMSYPQAMRYVILPQAVRTVLPPLGNDFISMLKDSALISVLALPDLLQLGRLNMSRTFRAFESFNTVAIMYLMMTFFLSMLVRVIERRTRLPR